MGTNLKPLFKDEHLDYFAQKLDDLTFKKGPIDVVDKPVYRFALGMLNRTVSDDVPDQYKDEFYQALDLVVAEDWDDAGAEAIDVVKDLVMDWEKVSPGAREIIVGVLDIVKGALAGLD
jgi:hypothetical protein